MYRPPFTLTARIVDACAEISRAIGRVEALPNVTPRVQLRRRNRIRTVHATLAIEGAGPDERGVTAIVDGKRVLGAREEVLAVKNAIAAYSRAADFDPGRPKDLLAAHGVMMKGLINDAGRFRERNVGVLKGSKVAHMAPQASRVPHLIEQLLGFVANDRATHPLIRAAVVHYELEFIHPFTDGNGRLGRLWQHRVLLDVHPLFEHVPVESVIRAKQRAYYAALATADRAGEATPFIEFALGATKTALFELVGELRAEPATIETRLAHARASLGRRQFSRRDYARLFPMVSMPTASRDLRAGVDAGVLVRTGDKATARYRFR
jgi:Fic family protein